jgi:hypothetical protein
MIKKEDVVFYVNEEKGVVVAKLKDKSIFYRLLDASCQHPSFKILDPYFIIKNTKFGEYKEQILNISVEGKSKCNMETDTFDLELGKKIAFLRLKANLSRYCIRLIESYCVDICKDVEHLRENYMRYLVINEKTIDRLEDALQIEN